MRVFKGIHKFKNTSKKPLIGAIGFFDGVHKGHKKVIDEAKELAKELKGEVIVITFDIHPKNLLINKKEIKLISTEKEKIELLKKEKIDNMLILYFGQEVADMDYESFYRHYLINILNLKAIVAGFNFHFGKNRLGTPEKLKELGKKYNCITKIVNPFKFKNQVVSSSRIRELLKFGAVDTVKIFLNRFYSIRGKVVRGNSIGSKFHVPTVNISVSHDKLTPQGVFVGLANISGKSFKCVINEGKRPTLENSDDRLHLEAHIFNFNKNVYGRTAELFFIKKLRDEKKFKNIETLFKQINKDIIKTKEFFKNNY